jgi:hypothetical protein
MKKYGVGLGPDLLKKKAWDKDKVPYPARRWP